MQLCRSFVSVTSVTSLVYYRRNFPDRAQQYGVGAENWVPGDRFLARADLEKAIAQRFGKDFANLHEL
jgi:hypothetical protein